MYKISSILKKQLPVVILTFVLCHGIAAFAQVKETKAKQHKIGAYYYDGWGSLTSPSLSKALIDSFPERTPKWGWVTSTPTIVEKQIDAASDAGLSFFSFCWYYKPGSDQTPLNNALKLFVNAPNSKRMDFCLMVANHEGFEIGPGDWAYVCDRLIQLFKSSNYLTVDQKPLLIFYTLKTLLNNFKTAAAVKKALDDLRAQSIKSGFKGLSIAVCVNGERDLIDLAGKCGFDNLTGYNYHHIALLPGKKTLPIDSMSPVSTRVWTSIKNSSKLIYIPVATLNWDPRPWATSSNFYKDAPRFTGYSKESVYHSVFELNRWLDANSLYTTKESIGLLYAWNEYGEGAWLTPSKNDQGQLQGLKNALK